MDQTVGRKERRRKAMSGVYVSPLAQVVRCQAHDVPLFFTVSNPRDEVFGTSSILAVADPTSASLADLLPDWFPPGSMRTDPDILLESLDGTAGQGVFHPVRGRASFCSAVAGRLAQNTHFLAAMRDSLARLTDEELTDIAAEAAIELGRSLRQAARPAG